MLASNRHIFVHLPKTGGTTTTRILARHDGGTVHLRGRGGHDPGWMVRPDELAGRTLIGNVRDPWSWYCSWYQHSRIAGDAAVNDLRTWGGGSIEWRDVLRGVTRGARSPHGIGVILRIPQPHRSDARAALARHHWGLASWLATWCYGASDSWRRGPVLARWGVPEFVHTSRLAEGLSALLGVPLDELSAFERANTRWHRADQQYGPADYRDWYDDEMMAWVQAADGWYAEALSLRPFGVDEPALSRAAA